MKSHASARCIHTAALSSIFIIVCSPGSRTLVIWNGPSCPLATLDGASHPQRTVQIRVATPASLPSFRASDADRAQRGVLDREVLDGGFYLLQGGDELHSHRGGTMLCTCSQEGDKLPPCQCVHCAVHICNEVTCHLLAVKVRRVIPVGEELTSHLLTEKVQHVIHAHDEVTSYLLAHTVMRMTDIWHISTYINTIYQTTKHPFPIYQTLVYINPIYQFLHVSSYIKHIYYIYQTS